MIRGEIRVRGLAAPAFAWLILLLAGPLALVAITAFLERGTYGGIVWQPTLANLLRLFDPVYLRVLFLSLRLALLTTALCVLIGFPMALAMASAGARARGLFVLALAVPCLMNLVIRVYAVKAVVSFAGPLVAALQFFGIAHDPFALSQNAILVLYGMVTTYLPFFVFPVYAALEKFDFTLVEAAQDLGASPLRVSLRVILPCLATAVRNGALLVFIPALGEFVIPDLLGGARTMLIGNLITEQFLKARDWPFGSALGLALLLMRAVALALFFR